MEQLERTQIPPIQNVWAAQQIPQNLSGHFQTKIVWFAIQWLLFLRGKNALRWTCWDQNSLSLVQRFSLIREHFKRGSIIINNCPDF